MQDLSVYDAAEIGVTNAPIFGSDGEVTGYTPGRPPNIVENDAEIRLLFAEEKQPTVVCGWCGQTFRTRKLLKALHWFYEGHKCGASHSSRLAA